MQRKIITFIIKILIIIIINHISYIVISTNYINLTVKRYFPSEVYLYQCLKFLLPSTIGKFTSITNYFTTKNNVLA
jgi:hypothetical protein